MSIRQLTIFGATSIAVSFVGLEAQTQALSSSLNQYGTVGLIDMPTAESLPDAEFSVTASSGPGFKRGSFTFQVLPRLSGSFRYTQISNWSGDGDLFDRSFDLQYRIFDETKYRPSVAVGLRDFMGTGIYSGEYFVATKTLHPKLKATLGVGWGRFSDRNEYRAVDFGEGGVPETGEWFRGPVGAFGGIEWQTPVKNLTFKAEYSSDRYARENEILGNRVVPTFDRKTPLNFGLEYSRNDSFTVGLYYKNGSEFGLNFSTSLNPKRGPVTGHRERAPTPITPRAFPRDTSTAWRQIDGIENRAVEQLNSLLNKDGLYVQGLKFDTTSAELRIENTRYIATPQAFGRAARAMAFVFPDTVETFTIIPMVNGLAVSAVTINRSELEQFEHHPEGTTLMARAIDLSDVPTEGGAEQIGGIFPRFRWSLAPYATLSLFDSQEPFDANLGVRLTADYQVTPQFGVSGSIKKNLLGSLDFEPPGPSGLPRVRTNIKRYRSEGDPALETLVADYFFKLRPDVYGRVSAGYLESMFGGVSAEVLWKPSTQNWGVGAEVNYVKQRDFDQLLGFQDYSVATGHVTGYVELARGFSAQVDVGRYLAGDVGATLSVDRTFDNGWRIGAYATLTDVPFEDFGEGSFDKGIRLEIPLGWALGTASRRTVRNNLASLTRDGGAKLSVPNRLYPTVKDYHSDTISGAWGRFWR